MTFSEIIQRRSDRPHYPLWKLKVTDDEYKQLKKELCETYNQKASFDTVQDEAMLYLAEWYRREYDCDGPSKEAVFQSLQSNSRDCTLGGEALYKAALHNAKWINDEAKMEVIQFVEGEKNMAWFYSLLYQGGLPLMKIVNNSNVWRNTIRKMVWCGLDFEETELPVTAAKSESIHSFCERVVDAALCRQYLLMPFYCNDENDEAYLFLTKEIEEGTRNRKTRIPFDIQWKFKIDEPAHLIELKYALDAPQRLQEDFIQHHQLNGSVFFRIRIDDDILPGPEYRNLRSFCPFHFERLYNSGEEITVLAGANERVICTDSMDFSEPHVIHKEQGEGCFLLGYGHNSSDVRILFEDEWECITNQEVHSYHLGNSSMSVVFMGNEDVVLQNNNGETKRFSTSTQLCWTEFENAASQDQYVQTTLFQIDKMRFYRCEDEIGRQRINNSNVSFWNYNTKTWDNNPLIGKIKARVPDGKGGFATSKMFLNTGTPIKMRIISCTETTCTVRFDWESGTVICNQGKRVQNGDWTFEKGLFPSDGINCICTPKGASKQTFSIKVHIPFKGFYIFDSEGYQVQSRSLIPYADFNVYRYSLNDEDVFISIDGTSLPNIRIQNNSNGYLKDVLEREGGTSIRMLLNKDANSVEYSRVILSVKRADRSETYIIKEYPYTFSRDAGIITITAKNDSNSWNNKDYNGNIIIIPFDRNKQHFVLRKEDGQYTLPEEVRQLGKVLLISPQQRVVPKVDDLSEKTGLTPEQHEQIKEEQRNHICKELKSAKIDSDIWQRCQYWYDIWYNNKLDEESLVFPWNSVFEYKYIAKDANALIELVLVLWLNCNDDAERDNLMNNLLDHERDLALQWFWLSLFNFHFIESFFDVDANTLREKLWKWALLKGRLLDLHNALDPIVLLSDALIDFGFFWEELRKQSLMKGEGMDKIDPDMINMLLKNDQTNKMPIEFDEDACLEEIAKDNGMPRIKKQSDTEIALTSFMQDQAWAIKHYPEAAINFCKRVWLLIYHRNNTIDLLKCNLPLRATVLYYYTKYAQKFVYFLYKYRNTPKRIDIDRCLLYDD